MFFEGLHREEKVVKLGSRNFFLCPKNTAHAGEGISGNKKDGSVTTPFVSCANEVDKAREYAGCGGGGGGGFGWFKLMNFMM